jgi:hypothetical protein
MTNLAFAARWAADLGTFVERMRSTMLSTSGH